MKSDRILVCIGPDELSKLVIKKGWDISRLTNAHCQGIYVETTMLSKKSDSKRNHLIKSLKYAESLNIETLIISGKDIADEIIKFAKAQNITRIVIGKPTKSHWKNKLTGSLAEDLIDQSSNIDIFIVSNDETKYLDNLSHSQFDQKHFKHYQIKSLFKILRNYIISLLIISVCTWISFYLFGKIDLANIVMIYILGVVYISYHYGAMPSIFASLVGVATLDYLFVPHYFSFEIRDIQYLITLFVMLIVGGIIGKLTDTLSTELKISKQRESQTHSLYSMSRELSKTIDLQELLTIICTHIGNVFHTKVLIFLPDQQTNSINFYHVSENIKNIYNINDEALQQEFKLIHWVFEHALPIGLGLNQVNQNFDNDNYKPVGVYFPLKASHGIVGVVGIIATEYELLHLITTPESRHLLETFFNQSALAIERNSLAIQTQEIQLEMMSERLRNALLNSISHDLNTPLSIISGSATSLLQARHSLDDEQQEELLQTIFDQSQSVSRLVRNLLYMTRLESGVLKPNKEWQDIEELIGSVLNRIKSLVKKRPINVEIPMDFPLVLCDSILISQILQNFLENALKYTEYPLPIIIRCELIENNVVLQVIDSGKGIPESEISKVFEKFYRGKQETTQHGNGLGLSICEGIILLHQGKIWAKNNENQQGMTFGFSIPYEPMPEMFE